MNRTRLIFIALFACLAGGLAGVSRTSARDEKTPPTFSKEIAPIFYKNCVECHRPGEIAPMSLITYKEIRPWAKSIREKVANREMPPWHADPAHGEWANDKRLTQKEIDTIVAWVGSGAKEGDPKDLPPIPQFANGWQSGEPDVIFQMPEEVAAPARGQ